jgi:putative endonuclease
MWHVYIVECSDKSLYTGITNDLTKRIDRHNGSITGAKYTKARRPVRLVYSRAVKNRSSALKEEYKIKKMSRSEKVNLFKPNNMGKIILIGGAPLSGKSYIAEKLAKKLGIPWISTDAIRDMMRKLVNQKDYPALFNNYPPITAEKYFKKFSPIEVVRNEISESLEVWKGVQALISNDYAWDSFIIEGIAVLPGSVHKAYAKQKNIKAIFLSCENKKLIKDRILKRGLYDDADNYPNSLKDIEIEWTLLINKTITTGAKRYGYPVHEIGKPNNDLEAIIKLI